MNSNWINTIFDWCVNFLMNVATAIGTSYEALNVWIFVLISFFSKIPPNITYYFFYFKNIIF